MRTGQTVRPRQVLVGLAVLLGLSNGSPPASQGRDSYTKKTNCTPAAIRGELEPTVWEVPVSDELKDEPPTIEVRPRQFPQGHPFPDEILQKWLAISPQARLIIGPLTRNDIDHLLFSFSDLTRGIADLQMALIHYSHGRRTEAETLLQNSWNAITDAETRNRRLFHAIMAAVVEVPQDG